MLNGIDPIIIFHFKKKVTLDTATISKIPLTSQDTQKSTFAIVPIYLNEKITGLYIDTEEKNLDIETTALGLTDGAAALMMQRPVNSTVSINLVGSKDSLGLTLILAMADQIFDKVVSQEYEITYIHGAVSVFSGLLHGFAVTQDSDNTLYKVKIELARGNKSKTIEVSKQQDTIRLGGGPSATPPTNLPPLGSTPATAPQSISPIQSSPVSIGGLR